MCGLNGRPLVICGNEANAPATSFSGFWWQQLMTNHSLELGHRKRVKGRALTDISQHNEHTPKVNRQWKNKRRADSKGPGASAADWP